MTKSFLEANAETVKAQLKELAKGIKTSKDPETLESFRKLIKKSLSFAERKYLAAYLLTNNESLLYSGDASRSNPFQSKRSKKENQKKSLKIKKTEGFIPSKKGKANSEEVFGKESVPKKSKNEGRSFEPKPGQKTLFISIGKNRKVFPSDIQDLFTQVLDCDSSQFGEIKIFPKYSFIDLAESLCDLAIEKLNSTEFHGIKIKVNYSNSSSSAKQNHEVISDRQEEPLSTNDQILE